MTLIMWDKPRKKMSKEAWKEDYGFEDGPTGGYQPNMSGDDAARWKGKITGTKLGFPQVEIRKAAGGSLMTMIINLGDGYNYKYYKALPDDDRAKRYKEMAGTTTKSLFGGDWLNSHEDADYFIMTDIGTAGINVHMSMNGPSTFSFTEMAEMALVIEEAKATLEAMIGEGERLPYVAYTDKLDVLAKEIEGIEGCRVRTLYPAISAVGFTATELGITGIMECETLRGDITILPHKEAEKREKRAYDIRHGFVDEEDDDE